MTSFPSWLRISPRHFTIPMFGRLFEARVSSTSIRPVRVSPGRTGAGQRRSSIPGDPRLVVCAIKLRTSNPMNSAPVCQPLAIRPP